jgi:wyosine [tRNA(Phe)-imidazoG37] synthetase (radical SAM superfamily)
MNESSPRGSRSGVADHRRDREAGRLVYPVISRRSGGLSLGINLFPEGKDCNFDCPYCEVFSAPAIEGGSRSGGRKSASLAELEAELESFASLDYPESWAPEPVRDICFSGNGEPTLSPLLGGALELCSRFRDRHPESLGGASLVLITNATGFLDPAACELLERFCSAEGLVIWAKLDAGGEELFRLMAGLGSGRGGRDLDCSGAFDSIVDGLLSFARRTPVVIQTMLCEVDGRGPSAAEVAGYASLLGRLTREGAQVAEVHLYTFARPSPSGRCQALPDSELARHAAFVRGGTGLRVRAFGSAAELSW